MNPYDAAMATIKAIGDIFKFIGRSFSFIFNGIGKIWTVFIDFVRNICTSIGIMGLSSTLLKIVLSGLVGICILSVLSLIPDLITYFGCRLSKKYRKLNTKEEKSEYTSKHTHFLLKLFLSVHNNSLRRKAERIAKKAAKKEKKNAKRQEKLSKKEAKIAKEREKTESIVDESIDEILNDEFIYEVPVADDFEVITDEIGVTAEPVIKKSLPVRALPEVPTPTEIPVADDFEVITDEKGVTAEPVIEESLPKLPTPTEIPFESNIKILYTSDIVGKMLRKGVVLDRKMGATNNPVLIDFTDKPREIFTGHLCDSESGIRIKKYVSGELVEYMLDNPEILNNPQILESIKDKEVLENLLTRLQNDIRYRANMENFFNIHDKAMSKIKEMNG